jgi:hypothetical protein
MFLRGWIRERVTRRRGSSGRRPINATHHHSGISQVHRIYFSVVTQSAESLEN